MPHGHKSPYLRASYSIAPEEKFDEAFQRLAELIREEQELQGKANESELEVSQ